MNYKELLEKQIESDHLSHAYMVVGKYFDRQLLIDDLVAILGSSKEDVLKIVSDKSISIDEIKSLKRELTFPPFNSLRKIAIIALADVMTTEAQNALLKILEEPAKRVVVFLITRDEDRILPTIISRCQKCQVKNNLEVGIDFTEGLLAGNLSIVEKFKLAEGMSKEENLEEILDGWLITLKNQLMCQNDRLYLLGLIKEVRQARKYLRTNANTRLILENLMLKF